MHHCGQDLTMSVLCVQFDSSALEASIQEVRVANMQLKADSGKTVEKLRTLTQRLETLEKRPAQVGTASQSTIPARYTETPPATPPGPLLSQGTAAPRTFSQMPSVAGRTIASERSLAHSASTAASVAPTAAATIEPAVSLGVDSAAAVTREEASSAQRRESETSASVSNNGADSSSGKPDCMFIDCLLCYCGGLP